MPILRDAWRALRATPVVSGVAILSLALGIGANTAIFSILNSLLVRTLPVPEPSRLVQVFVGENQSSSTNPIWEQLRDRTELFDGIFAWTNTRFNLAEGGETQFVPGMWASGAFFDVLGVHAILGRTFTPRDDARSGGPDGPVTVISYGFWQRGFGGASDVIGKKVSIERVAFTVIGVTPPEFFGPEVGNTFDVVIPIGTEPLIRGRESYLDARSTWWLRIMARLKPGQSIESATAAVLAVQPQIREATVPPDWRSQDKTSYLKGPFVLRAAGTGTSALRTRYQQPLYILMGIVALVLLIACANIANLLLARATARRHELSVRLALGASRWRLARQLLTESLLLSSAGALLGIAFAQWGSRLLVAQLSTQTPGFRVFLDLSLDWRVLGFTTAVAGLTAMLFGTAPALRATRVQPMESLKERGRVLSSEARLGLGSALVVAQIALSLTLVVGAGLFMRTFSSLATLNLGFDRNPILIVNVNARKSAPDPATRLALYERVRQAVTPLPGVANVALSVITPVSGSTWNTTIENPPGMNLTPRERDTYINYVTPGWFKTYGIAFVGGRDFAEADRAGAAQVAVINETAARRFFPGGNPIGQRLREVGRGGDFFATDASGYEIVGVVKDAVYNNLRTTIPATMYRALAQQDRQGPGIDISVRAAGGSPAALVRSVSAAVSGVDQDLALTFRPLADQIGSTLIRERLLAMLSGFFGALALLLAGLGLYGVMSYAVNRRRTEIGIRMALGADPGRVLWLVLRRVVVLVMIGSVAGGALSLWAGRFVATLLYGLQPRDPITLGGAVLVLAASGILASWLPARRAARIDPTTALREG